MQPLVRGAIAIAALSALVRAAESTEPARPAAPDPSAETAPASTLQTFCPPQTLADHGVCIPVPEAPLGGDELAAHENVHRDRRGQLRVYEQIPRRPERPSDYRRYRMPVEPLPHQSFVVSGYDLDRPASEQRQGPGFKAVGHGGIDIAQKRGTEVRIVALEHQVGDAEVLFVGPVFGNSVVTRHSLREGGRLRDYVVIHGHLEGAAPGLAAGQNVREGSLIGFVGDSGSPGDVHLHLEVRRVRDGIDARQLASGALVKNDKTVVCDPRNVLPLRDR